jgi:hypothetical protein
MIASRTLCTVGLLVALLARPAGAAVSTGEPAALLVFPLIHVDQTAGDDSLIQLTNADTAEVAVRCLYENPSGARAFTSFTIRLAANQPVAWRAGAGSPAVAGDGGTIPPLGADPFTGVLRCLTVDSGGAPSDRNALVGSVTLEHFNPATSAAPIDSARYDAFGVDAQAGAVNADEQLVLGGAAAEYAACPQSMVLQSPLDAAVLTLGTGGAVQRELSSTLAMVTCAQGANTAASATVSFEVTNEFGNRSGVTRSLQEQWVVPLSHIDSANPATSIFSAPIQGSLTGAIRITSVSGSGVLALTVQAYADPNDAADRHTAAISPQLAGERTDADVVDLAVPTTTPACVGDCDGDGSVAINELVTGVSIALGNQVLSACPAFDADGDGSVAINELITAVNNALAGCK